MTLLKEVYVPRKASVKGSFSSRPWETRPELKSVLEVFAFLSKNSPRRPESALPCAVVNTSTMATAHCSIPKKDEPAMLKLSRSSPRVCGCRDAGNKRLVKQQVESAEVFV